MKKFLFSHSRRVCLLLLLIAIGISNVFAQQVTITGTVTDAQNLPVPNATVQVKGTQAGTVTTINGIYSIKASKGQILVFKFLSFDTKEVAIGSATTINVTLNQSDSRLNEVVVIGYGTQKRADITGSVAKLVNENLNERAITRVDQALVGQLAGVTVKQTTGIPGAGFSIQVRGSGSIGTGNEPLYVIDGFPLAVNSSNVGGGSFSNGNPLDNINPNDIESIEVLKDAAAAAIYGSRASNGVVLITTKRGQVGKAKITFNSYAGFNAAAKHLDMLNGQQWIDRATEMINAAYVLKYGAAGATANDDQNTRRSIIGLAGTAINTAYMLDPRWALPGHPGLEFKDWQNEIERRGGMQNTELSASGGTENVKYFVSGNYANQDGYVQGVGYKAYSLRANVEVNASKKLKFGINIAPTYSITQNPGVDGKDQIFHQALSTTPVQEDTVGNYPNIGKNATYFWSNSINGGLGKLQNVVGQTKRYRTLGTIFGEYQIIKGLTLRSSINFDNADQTVNNYTPYIVTGTQASRTFTGANNLTANTSGSYNSYRHQVYVNENTINYNTTINSVHSINLLLGQSYNFERLDNSSESSSGGYTSAIIQTLNAAAAITGNTTSTENVLESYFARAQYGYKDKYLLSASIRRDGSSRFGTNSRYGIFPSASVAWRLIQENFMKTVPAVSDLKIRASYGVNGNNNIGNYGSIATLGSSNYALGSTQVSAIGQFPNVLANANLQWEKSATYDIGVDFGILGNRITGSFDYYNKLNTQLLLNVQVPESTGFGSELTNDGSVRNIGEELEITTHNLIGKFQWNTTLNISHNTNKIVSLAAGQNQIIIPNGLETSDAIDRVGEAVNSIYVVRQIGFLTADDIANKVAVFGTGETVGDPKYQDLNGDGVITEADKQVVGHPNPDFTFGITNTFRYKGFDLSVLVQGTQGGSIYSQLGRAITRTGQGFTDNAPASFVHRWESPTNQGDGRFSKAYSTFGFVANTDWLYASDYIRVRDITLGYNLKGLIKSPVVQGARIYITLENFFGGDKYYNGLNPEAQNTGISSNGNYPESGDYGGLPLAKSLIFGINFTF